MTDIISLLAKTYCKNRLQDEVSPRRNQRQDNECDTLSKMLSPLRESMNRSPFARRFSKERTPDQRSPSPLKKTRNPQQIPKDLVKTCNNDINNFRVHKSIAEDLFKGYNLYQKKKQKNQLNDKNQSQKHKYTPQKQIKEQVQKFLSKGNQKQTDKTEKQEEENEEEELVLVKVGRLGVKEESEKPQKKIPRAKTIHRASNSVFQNLKNLNLSQVSQNTQQNIEKQQVNQSITAIQKKPEFNLDVYQTQYMSNSHYRSRSASGLRNQTLQSTKWLNENINLQQIHRQKLQTSSQSPEKTSVDKVKKPENKIVPFERKLQLDQSIEGSIKNSDIQINNKMLKPVLTQQSSVQKHNFNPENKTPTRTLVQSKKPSIIQDVIKEEKQYPSREFKLSVSPMRGSLQQDPENKQNTWIQSQISKEKARLMKNYSLYSMNQTKKIQKQQQL